MGAASETITELAKAFETANVEMFAVRMPEAVVAAVTSAVLRKWNCAREELVGRQLAKYGTGALSARHVSTEEGGAPGQKIEINYVPPLGSSKSTVFTPQTWADSGQKFMLLIGQHASLEQAEEAIQNERRLSLALRSGGYAAWDHDYRTGETYNSPEFYDLLGFERGTRELNFNSFNDLVHSDDRRNTLDDQIKSSPFGSDMFQTRYRVKNRAGHYVWIESIAGVIRNPVDGRPMKCVGLSRNIGDQMAALEKMQASERVLKRSQRAARLGSFTINVDSGSSRLSTEMIALIGMSDAIVQPNLRVFEKMIEPADRDKFREAVEDAKKGNDSPAFEIAYKTLVEGELNYFEVKVEADRNANGEVEQVFGTCQSITERKLLERKFMQAQKMEAVGQLTGGIAHDFNNLLMVVLGNLQLIEQLVKNDERALKRIRAAHEAAEKGSELTKRMLAFSRQQTLQKRDLDVNGLLDRMRGILGHAVGAGVDLDVVLHKDIWPVRTDATMLETAVLNLCINARDAMKPKGGRITIETLNRSLDAETCADLEDVAPGDYVEIAVTDTGCGIAPENIEKVFQPFFTTKGPEAGSGLGLSMIYGFVKQSGGHIKIYSEVGHGTTMRIYLPRLVTAEQPEAKAVEPFVISQVPPVAAPEQFTAEPGAAPFEFDAVAEAPSAPPMPAPAEAPPEPEETPEAAAPFAPEADTVAEAAPEEVSMNVLEESAPEVAQDEVSVPVLDVATPEPAPEEAAFPAPEVVLSTPEAVPAPEVEPAPRRPLVLVVEDNPSVRDVAAAMIEDMGYDVITAANGVEGLQAIVERLDINLVLSDVIMAGGLNGPEMALKALAVRPELKVLFMSGYAPGSLRQMQEELPNAVDLVNKPFTRNDLTEKVKRALAA